jgi:hypothetical protein
MNNDPVVHINIGIASKPQPNARIIDVFKRAYFSCHLLEHDGGVPEIGIVRRRVI